MIPASARPKAFLKNTRLLVGKSLISYVLEVVSSVSDREHIVVSTDQDIGYRSPTMPFIHPDAISKVVEKHRKGGCDTV